MKVVAYWSEVRDGKTYLLCGTEDGKVYVSVQTNISPKDHPGRVWALHTVPQEGQ